MIDLHCHILCGLDDGASDLSVSLDMARMLVDGGVETVACTPHILPGLYHNDARTIRAGAERLRAELVQRDIKLEVVCGSDAHMTPDFVAKLKGGEILTLAESRYVLVEPPHHVAPIRLEQFFFEILIAGYVPVLTHPERLTWIDFRYATIERLARSGVWMQVTAGSLVGDFGRSARYWAERMLDDRLVHILASDAHDVTRRPPNLAKGWEAARKRVGDDEARHLVLTRPRGVLKNESPSSLSSPFHSPALKPPKRA